MEMLSGSWTASIWGICVASITAGSRQACNPQYVYPCSREEAERCWWCPSERAPAPFAHHLWESESPQPSAGAGSRRQQHPPAGQPARPGAVRRGCASSCLCLRSSFKKTSNCPSGISCKLKHRFPRRFWPPESCQPSSFHGPCFRFHPLVIKTVN